MGGAPLYYTTAADLIARTSRAAVEGRRRTTMRFWNGPQLLVIEGLLGSEPAGIAVDFDDDDSRRASRFPLASTSSFTTIRAYLDGGGAPTGSQPVRGVIYSGRSGARDQRLAASRPGTITAAHAPGYVTLASPHT